MLVLSRKAGEKIVIGDNLVITVNRIAGNRVALGIEAPDKVRVMRSELLPGQAAEAESQPLAAASEPPAQTPSRLLRRSRAASVVPSLSRRLLPMPAVSMATE